MKPTHDSPRFFRLLDHSQLQPDCWHSLLIAALRGAAALEVAAAHVRAEFFPGLRSVANPALWYQALAFFTGFAHQAVIVFFVISGWLVGGSLLNKLGQPEAFKLYAIDRITRLWTVLLPTFTLALALAILTGQVDARSVDFSLANEFSVLAWAGNMVGLQTIVLPQFGGNYPLWSLANESWYYLMFPLLVVSLGKGSSAHRLLAAGALVGIAAFLPAAMLLYFSVWLLGAALSRVRVTCGAATRVLLVAMLLASSIYFRLVGSNDDLVGESLAQDLLLALLLLLILSASVVPIGRGGRHARLLRRCERTAQFFSNFSFTLYVVHVPLLGLLGFAGMTLFGTRQVGAASLAHLAIYGALLGAVIGFSYGFYRLFEARTARVRRVVKNLLVGQLQVAPRAAPAKR